MNRYRSTVGIVVEVKAKDEKEAERLTRATVRILTDSTPAQMFALSKGAKVIADATEFGDVSIV